jgi:hypothetical protein
MNISCASSTGDLNVTISDFAGSNVEVIYLATETVVQIFLCIRVLEQMSTHVPEPLSVKESAVFRANRHMHQAQRSSCKSDSPNSQISSNAAVIHESSDAAEDVAMPLRHTIDKTVYSIPNTPVSQKEENLS